MSSTTAGGPGAGPSMADLDHSDHGPNILAAAFTTWAIALLFVLLRFYTRARIVRALGLADWFIALSLIAAGGMCVSLAVEVNHGLGRHIWDVDMAAHGSQMLKAWWIALLCYVLTLALTKVSICLLFLTIFTFAWARRACYVALSIVIIANLWATATTFTYCIPLQATWDPTVKASFCQSQEAWWANTGQGIATDLLIFLIPIPFVLPLKLPRRQKVVVVGIFAVGFFVCIVSLVRLAILIQAKGNTDPDFTFVNIDLTYWTVLEAHTAIVVACTMTLKPLVAKFFPDLLAPRTGSTSKSDEPSAASSEPPLTIGSRPSRPLPGELNGGQGGDGGVGMVGIGEVILGDIEQQQQQHNRGVEGEMPAGEKSTGKSVDVAVYGHTPWARSDAGSERTGDLGREMTARSIS